MKTILIATSNFNKKILSKKINFFNKKKIKVIINPYKKTITSKQIKTFMNDSLLGILSGNEILNKETLKEAKNLKIISRCGVGFNNIDVGYIKKKILN